MAISNSIPPPDQQTPTSHVDATTAVFESLAVSSPPPVTPARRKTTTLGPPVGASDAATGPESTGVPGKTRRELGRRDSLNRREALLKGHEGSRRRQRWENDHLLHVPNAQPPLPTDWEVRPTHPVHTVPYYLAPLWDAGVRLRAEELAAARKRGAGVGVHEQEQKGRIPTDLRQKLKKSKGAKTLLQGLEEEIREFVLEFERKEKEAADLEGKIEVDSEDEEIVFIGRNGVMSDEQRKTVEEVLEREKLVFDSLADDHGATFGRWLVHSIAGYYGLNSRSITVGNPARREAYVSIKELKAGRRLSNTEMDLPRPLWGMI